VPSLDLLRAIAVLLVLGRHSPPAVTESWTVWAIVTTWVRGGWIGVDVFFVLSGFLVSGLLFREYTREKALHVGRFWLRRALRILPPAYLLLALTTAGVVRDTIVFDRRRFVGELLYLQNYVGMLWNHTWSLAVEEHFYLLLPCVLIVLARRSRPSGPPFRGIGWTFLFAAVACLVLRWSTMSSLPYLPITHLIPTHLRIDALAFGVLLSHWHHVRGDPLARAGPLARVGVGICGVALLAPMFVYTLESSPFLYVFGLTLLYLGSGLLLLSILPYPCHDPVSRALVFIGRHSYSIYLWHFPVRRALDAHLTRLAPWLSSCSCLFLYFAAAIGVGLVMAKLIELPTLALRDRLVPTSERAAPIVSLAARPAR
jgi:peptidoglycan/LPS O-acetylase OafA/YrhL